MSTKDPIEFGKVVLQRREQLGLSQIDVWNKRGPSNSTLTVIENGRMADLTPATAKKLDNGLDWRSGSALALWRDGTTPTPVDPGETRPARRQGVVATLGDAVHLSNLTERVEELEFRLSAIESLVYRQQKEGGEGNAGSTPSTSEPEKLKIVTDEVGQEKSPARSSEHLLPTAASKTSTEPSVNKRRRRQDEAAEENQDPGGMNPA